ncbi:hypothetical protein BUE76_07680 [Cnuella takakiae]|nr:hypothetical protein BUE76_07680 [Cnuella takakiae]
MLVGLRSISRAAERKKIIEQMLQENQYGIVIIDGAGDLVEDVNDLAQAIECRIWLREMTVKHQVSIITTLHPNPGINASKPRGHLGSEVCRESECVLLAKKVDEATRIITTEFENGKNRNSAPITSAYRWCDDAGMFITTDASAVAGTGATRKNNSQAKLELLALKVLAPPKALCYSDLCKAITETGGYAAQTAKTKVKEMKSAGLIDVHPDGFYRQAA